MQARDLFKFIYQSAFGCEHMVLNFENSVRMIEEETKNVQSKTDMLTENLCGEYSRVSLEWQKTGLSEKTLAKLFMMSAKHEENGKNVLRELLDDAKELVKQGNTPFSEEEYSAELALWENEGFPAVRHSEKFRNTYAPSYRVVSNRFVPFLPLFCKIDSALENGNTFTLAIEGGSASGKSTLSEVLEEVYGCTVFHMDDFFLRPEQRTEERLSEIGGNVDRERFLSEVLVPLSERKPVMYRRFDCQSLEILSPQEIVPTSFTVVEGAYCMHPELSSYYDFSVFLDVSEECQTERIKIRNSPLLAKRFFEEWIPMERRYFEKMDIKNKCDMSVVID
jgi:uridine kinase